MTADGPCTCTTSTSQRWLWHSGIIVGAIMAWSAWSSTGGCSPFFLVKLGSAAFLHLLLVGTSIEFEPITLTGWSYFSFPAVPTIDNVGSTAFFNLKRSSQITPMNNDDSGAKAVVAEAAVPKTKREKRTYTPSEIRLHHSNPLDAYLIINNEVYDVTQFAQTHPGGSIILKYAGKDATDQFATFHRPRVGELYLKALHVGSLEGGGSKENVLVVDEATRDYRKLRERLWSEGECFSKTQTCC